MTDLGTIESGTQKGESLVTEEPPKPKKPVAKGRRWKRMFEKDFIRTFPRLGAARLAKRALKRKRKKKFGPDKIYRYPGRDAPSKRKGAKFSSIMVPLDVYLKLKELSKFYKKSMAQIMREQVEPLFDEAYKQAELLARIEKNKEKNSVSPYTSEPGRRTHF